MAAHPPGGGVRGRHRRIPGQSYARDEYEAIVPFILARVRLRARDVAETAHAYAMGIGGEVNQLRLARIEDERERALATYRRDRDPHNVTLARRAVVHFAVDPDLVFLTTKLEGKKTDFLPFNRGSDDHGKGNPENPGGYKTSYLWEQGVAARRLARHPSPLRPPREPPG